MTTTPTPTSSTSTPDWAKPTNRQVLGLDADDAEFSRHGCNVCPRCRDVEWVTDGERVLRDNTFITDSYTCTQCRISWEANFHVAGYNLIDYRGALEP